MLLNIVRKANIGSSRLPIGVPDRVSNIAPKPAVATPTTCYVIVGADASDERNGDVRRRRLPLSQFGLDMNLATQ